MSCAKGDICPCLHKADRAILNKCYSKLLQHIAYYDNQMQKKEKMTELLTSKQVQDLLQVDRTTVYRMLKDGRLTGIKVGSQWRFRRQEIDELLTLASTPEEETTNAPSPSEVLPVHCVQSIQNVFAQIAEVGAVTTDMKGAPLTEISHCSQFCQLIQDSPSGRKACMQSWQQLVENPDKDPEFAPCHAGLQYARGYIEVENAPIAMIVAGQFYVQPSDETEEAIRLKRLAAVHGIDHRKLSEAALDIPVINERMETKIGIWMKEVANTFGDIGSQRADMLNRLRVISDISNLELSI